MAFNFSVNFTYCSIIHIIYLLKYDKLKENTLRSWIMFKSTVIISFLLVVILSTYFLIQREWQSAITIWAFYGGFLSIAVYFSFYQKKKKVN